MIMKNSHNYYIFLIKYVFIIQMSFNKLKDMIRFLSVKAFFKSS